MKKKTPHTHFQTILFINVSIDNINSILNLKTKFTQWTVWHDHGTASRYCY